MPVLEIGPMDLGPDVRAVGLELVEGVDREPVRGPEAARIWSRVIPAIAGPEPWTLDLFSHLERLREFCEARQIPYRGASRNAMILPSPSEPQLEQLFERLERETFGARAGAKTSSPDDALEGALASRGVDAYHKTYPEYFFCAVAEPEGGSMVVLSDCLWASEILRRVRPKLSGLDVQVRMAA